MRDDEVDALTRRHAGEQSEDDLEIYPYLMKNPAAVSLGRLGGLKKSAVKAASSRKNGKKGGRPKTILVTRKDAPPNAYVKHETIFGISISEWNKAAEKMLDEFPKT